MNRRNYQKELDAIIEGLKEDSGYGAGSSSDTQALRLPRLMLHACCAPCSSYCVEYLSPFFYITLLFFNPNIGSREEYEKRASELKRLLGCMERDGIFPTGRVELRIADYDTGSFDKMARGLETAPERGERCLGCYELRLSAAAAAASREGFDYFTTTLSISPLKSADRINETGERLAAEYGVKHLPSDFKKRDGFRRSIQLSEKYSLYRQDYCGCVYSKRS